VSFFAHLADADITDRSLQQHQRQELRDIADGLEQRANEIVNESDPDSISFSPRWRNPSDQLQVNLVVGRAFTKWRTSLMEIDNDT
jgi:hypothetical protein